MPRPTLALLLALLLDPRLATGALAQPPAAAPEPAPQTSATASSAASSTASATTRAAPVPATPPPPKISFLPSETISEDTAVPFPADI